MKHKTWPLAAAVLLALLAWGPDAAAGRFEDVPDTYWAAPDIELCVEQGFFEGRTETQFAPLEAMERGVFISALTRFFGWTPGDVSSLPYQDVQPDAWYAPALAAAYREGAVTSQSTLFRPDAPITREELAVTLVRAMGYQSLAALAEPVPFEDVTTNTGYLGLASSLGLMNGSRGLFMPASSATRAQTAAVMSRLYRKMNAPSPRRMGIVSSMEELTERGGLQIAAIQSVLLTEGMGVNLLMDWYSATELRDAARAAGAEAFLGAAGPTLYRESVSLLLEEAEGFDGVYLNLTGPADPAYVRQLKEGLGSRPLYVAVPAPSDAAAVAYEALAESADALAESADALVVSVPREARLVEGFPVDPADPLEEVYEALRVLSNQVGAGKLCLALSGSGTLWTDGQYTGPVTGREVEGLAQIPGAQVYYSDRYACAYLRLPPVDGGGEQVAWYPDARGTAARVQLARLLGVGTLCLKDHGGVSQSVWDALA